MNAHTDLIDRYFEAWNETDAGRRRSLSPQRGRTMLRMSIRCCRAPATTASTQ